MKRCVLGIVVLSFFVFIFMGNFGWTLAGTPVCPFKTIHKDYGAPETRELLPNWHVIDGALKLYHKCQEETAERIAEINKYLPEGKKWKYNPKPNNPPYVCLTYAASTVADWWAIQLKKKLPKYKDFYNNKIEIGYNPRKLEVAYLARFKWHLIKYAKVPFFIEKCPVKGVSIPIRPTGYAEILTDKKTYTLKDPDIPGIVYHYGPDTYPMDYPYKRVFKQTFRKIKPEVVIDALNKWGIAMTQFEIPKKRYLMGTHTIAVVGWGEVDGQIAFLCHDSFGDYDVTHTQDAEGAPRYRWVRAEQMDELIVFPHRLDIKVKKLNNVGYQIEVRDSAGNLRDARVRAIFKELNQEIPVTRVSKGIYRAVSFGLNSDCTLRVIAEKKYFYRPDGKPHYVDFKP